MNLPNCFNGIHHVGEVAIVSEQRQLHTSNKKVGAHLKIKQDRSKLLSKLLSTT